MSNFNESPTPQQIKTLDSHFGENCWRMLEADIGEKLVAQDVCCIASGAMEDCADCAGDTLTTDGTFFRETTDPSTLLEEQRQALNDHFGLNQWCCLKPDRGEVLRLGDVVCGYNRVDELHGDIIDGRGVGINDIVFRKQQPHKLTDEQLLDAEFGENQWVQVNVGKEIQEHDVYINDQYVVETCNFPGSFVGKVNNREYYRAIVEHPESDKYVATQLLNARYGIHGWHEVPDGELIAKGDVCIGLAGINQAVHSVNRKQAPNGEQFYRAMPSIAPNVKPVSTFPDAKQPSEQPFKHPKGVNYYAEAIEILASDYFSDKRREIVIEIAKRHPKVLVDAHKVVFGETD